MSWWRAAGPRASTPPSRRDGSERTFGALLQRTSVTRFLLLCGMEHRIRQGYELETKMAGQRLEKRFRVKAEQGLTVVLDKFISYHTSRDYPERELFERATGELTAAKAAGFERIAAQHKAFLDEFWRRADVMIEGDAALQQALRFNAFHLLQSVGRDGRTSIAAKGVTGEGYDGHYFWDTEMYILPFFLYTKPDIARQLLRYRHHVLPKAKARAAEMGQAGALFAWRTIGGEETSPYPAFSTAQIHINADICHALRQYAEATGDKAFLYREGAEMLFETSRFFADYGAWIEGRGFCLTGVTGPDEYTTLVDNNAYTNLMVKEQLEYAVRVAREMRSDCPERWAELRDATGISEDFGEPQRAAYSGRSRAGRALRCCRRRRRGGKGEARSGDFPPGRRRAGRVAEKLRRHRRRPVRSRGAPRGQYGIGRRRRGNIGPCGYDGLLDGGVDVGAPS